MRFVSCQIVGFGKFVNRRFDFSNLTIFKEENGWGKSTLASFLECMIYGMEAGRNKGVEDNQRLKYEPWSGGRYGGVLIVSYQGKNYRIERLFGKTPVADTVKIYDENNMATYVFGEKGEWLGEKLFGMDRESYQKTVYLPQTPPKEDGMPSSLKEKLLSLLSVGQQSGNSQSAIERLDMADRALRARRRPGKGKLDEIDERIAFIQEKKAELYRVEENLQEAERECDRVLEKRNGLKSEVDGLRSFIDEQSKRSELLASKATYEEVKLKFNETQNDLEKLKIFFKDTPPESVNVDGLQSAVHEYYEIKEELVSLQKTYEEVNGKWSEKQAVKSQLTSAEKMVDSYRLLMEEKKKDEGAGKRSKEKKEEKPQRKIDKTWWLILCAIIASTGVILTMSVPVLGYVLLAFGGVFLLRAFFRCLPRIHFKKKSKTRTDVPEEILARYATAQSDVLELQKKLEACPKNLRQKVEELQEQISQKQERMQALERAIVNFLSHFAFGEIYDYRVALSTLRENVDGYARLASTSKEYGKKVEQYTPFENVGGDVRIEDLDNLRLKAGEMDIQKEELDREYARAISIAEDYGKRQQILCDYLAEEPLLQSEKERLERRLIAIRGAKELIEKARENMAKRYLEPVEYWTKEYQKLLFPDTERKVRFAGDGQTILEENGVLRPMQYYSEGTSDLLDLCVRLALSKTLAKGEPSPLILDDPFANLDDDKLDRAKRLVKTLAKEQQIIYFTCKTERTL